MSSLKMELLGGFRVHHEGKPILFTSRKAASLFAYVVVHRDQAHPRAKLADALWPDTIKPQQALVNLRHTLYQLPQTLKETCLIVDHSQLRFNPDCPCQLDVEEFKKLVAQSQKLNTDAEKSHCLEEAVALYRGEFMDGFDDDWIIEERKRWHALYLNTFLQLAESFARQRQYAHAIEHCERVTQQQPSHETAYRRQMLFHYWAGDLPAALETYQRCVRALRRHKIKPSAETRTLYEQMREHKAPAPPQRVPNNLPQLSTCFIGRESAMKKVKRLLTETHWLTLFGSGGCGKTQLALHATSDLLPEYPDGIWWIDLAPLVSPALVPQRVASVWEIKEVKDQPLVTTLINYLGSKRLLLVLDNCEHLASPCASLAEALLMACPNLRILMTSREVLGSAGETTWRVPSLACPGPESQHFLSVDELLEYGAVRLFVERVVMAVPSFELTDQNAAAVAQVCRCVDGIPLAIELAAAQVKQVKSHSLEQMAAQISDRFPELVSRTQSKLPRHQRLRATMDWSFHLLLETEQVLLRRLSVFAGGWTLGTAGAVCADDETCRGDSRIAPTEMLDLLTQLVNKSLVNMEQREETRYRLLETVRQYSAEKLAQSGEAAFVRERHLHFFMELAEQAELELIGPQQLAWLNRLEVEYDNLRAAMEWSLTDESNAEKGLRLAGALWDFWYVQVYSREACDWLERLLSKGRGAPAADRAKALNALGCFRHIQGEVELAIMALEESLTLWQQVGDKAGVASAQQTLAMIMRSQGDYPKATALLEESLAIFRQLGGKSETARSLINLALVDQFQGNFARAKGYAEECLVICREVRDDWGIAVSLEVLARSLRFEGDYTLAKELLEEDISIRQKLGQKHGLAVPLKELAIVVRLRGEYNQAMALLKQGLMLDSEGERKKIEPDFLEELAKLACVSGRYERAAQLFGSAGTLRETINTPMAFSDRSDYERHVADARAALGEEAFAQAWAKGRAMTLEQAIEYALTKVA